MVSITEKIRQVETLRTANSPRSISQLALMDRRAVGWITLIIGHLGVLMISGFILLLLWVMYLFALVYIGSTIFSVSITYRFNLTLWGWSTWVVVTSGFLARSKQVRKAVGANRFAPPDEKLPLVYEIILWPMKRLYQGWVIGVYGLFLSLSLFPIIGLFVDAMRQLIHWLVDWQMTFSIIRSFWPLTLICLVSVLVTILILQNLSESCLIALTYFVLGVLGLANIFWKENAYTSVFVWELTAIATAAALVYPLNLVSWFAWPGALSYKFLRNRIVRLKLRIRLRKLVNSSYQFYLHQNHQNTVGNGKLAVCKTHLRRFICQRDRISYMRWITYWWCPDCQHDNNCYTGVRCIQGSMDHEMDGNRKMDQGILEVNLITYIKPDAPPIPPELENIEIRRVDSNFDIEAFVTRYLNQTQDLGLRPLREIPCYVHKDVVLDPNLQRILGKNLKRVKHLG